jgi:hypothetical protein
MQDVTIRFTSGPMRDRELEFEVGRVVIGRLPGANGLELKGADTSVSREHAELVGAGGDVELRNLSPNGTKVDGKLVIDSVVLKPGAKVSVGSTHTFSVTWTAFETQVDRRPGKKASKPDAKKGPLSSPVVRAVIVVYLLGIVGVAIWLGVMGDEDSIASDDWPRLDAAYQVYQSGSMTNAERDLRLARAEVLVRELRALRTQGVDRRVNTICREMMRIDRDPGSPLYQYGAECLGTN